MSRRKRSEGRAGTVPRARREGSEARSPNEFDSLGQIRVFRRDVPESFEDGPHDLRTPADAGGYLP